MPFVANGRAAIERVVEEDPAAFLRIVASLVSKDIKIDRRLDAGPLSDFTDEELEALLYAARNAVAHAMRQQQNKAAQNIPADVLGDL
jgi:hypothetical protein